MVRSAESGKVHSSARDSAFFATAESLGYPRFGSARQSQAVTGRFDTSQMTRVHDNSPGLRRRLLVKPTARRSLRRPHAGSECI